MTDSFENHPSNQQVPRTVIKLCAFVYYEQHSLSSQQERHDGQCANAAEACIWKQVHA